MGKVVYCPWSILNKWLLYLNGSLLFSGYGNINHIYNENIDPTQGLITSPQHTYHILLYHYISDILLENDTILDK